MTANRQPAYETPGGHLVRHQDRLWVKAERPSKDYVNHYLVALEATPDLTLLYIDPEMELEIVASSVTLTGTQARRPGEPHQAGDLIAGAEGHFFIKTLDVKKDGQRHLAYVEVETGLVRFRPEREVSSIFSVWVLVEA